MKNIAVKKTETKVLNKTDEDIDVLLVPRKN